MAERRTGPEKRPAPARRHRQLLVLGAVTSAITRSADLREELEAVLQEVCSLLELTTGWVYLLDDQTGEPSLASARNLPPVFQEEPERWEGMCWCIHSLLTGNAKGAANVNVVACSRLWRVEHANPEGLRYHASIPFYSQGKQMGIMNVARHDWRPLRRDDLSLLTAIGNLLGMAVAQSRVNRLREDLAVKAERERMAFDLHDTLIQGLTGIALQLDTADAILDRDLTAARERVRLALAMVQETMAETRAAVHDLGPPALRETSFAEALQTACQEFSERFGIALDLRLNLGSSGLPATVERGVFRIVQEALNNLVKHSEAARASLILRQKDGRLTLILEDDGCGFTKGSASVHGYGLHSMARRVKLLGGRFRLKTAPGAGTRIEASIPLER